MLRKLYTRLRPFFGSNRLHDYGRNNVFASASAGFRDCRIKFFGTDNRIVVAEQVQATGVEITVLGSHNVLELGRKVTFGGGFFWFASDRGTIHIGEGTTVTGGSFTLTEPGLAISVGNDCQFAWGIDLRCGDGHAIIDVETGKKLNAAQPISIGDHVWLGANVQVLKGVTVGSHSVIGTRSVVTRSIPAHCVAAGVPARVIREGVTWLRENHPEPTERL